MRRLLSLALVLVLAGVLAGCGGGGNAAVTVFGQTLSDQRADGDVSFDPVLNTFTIAHATDTGNVILGIDEGNINFPEFRAFLDFPLDGSTGGDAIPLNAVIVSADIEVFVSRVDFATPVPTLLDLVTYPVTGPTAVDFNSPPLTPTSFRTLNFFAADEGNFVRIDVTPLMKEAQRQGLRNFQLRFLLDFVPGAAGLVTIADAGAGTAPLLTVEFF
ncbi:MAG: hypothetical protein HZA60_05545 [Deltaproteobacteria bacterium]|nr:hypothetical protein [Deltaproteobacteria bacterium]